MAKIIKYSLVLACIAFVLFITYIQGYKHAINDLQTNKFQKSKWENKK